MSAFIVVKQEFIEAIEALEYKATMEAGQSCEPTLFKKEDTHEWALAQRWRNRLAKEFQRVQEEQRY